ncbi:MAG TPA: ribosome biogenesis GTPase Der [Verrucomicrobiae bacterium]|nr:ribosome biogenesis GTPase Der [Verrucomicrobiae bacterium]
MTATLPVIVLVGRQNVGKSTLFNRLTGTRDALVADLPGLTRDRQYGFAEHGGKRFIVVDTGGLGPDAGDRLARLAEDQAKLALDEADAILFLTDARAGMTRIDQTIARDLRRRGKPVQVLINKAEGMSADAAADFFRLGLGDPKLVSAERGQGIGGALEVALAAFAPAADAATTTSSKRGATRVAIIGRPNVGKSTLVNRLVGEDRVLTADQPGTTRDSITVPFQYDGRDYELVDTAGIRRRARVSELVEKISVVKSLQAIDQADVVIAVVDAQDEIGVHDARLLGLVAERGRGLVLAVNKWDGLEGKARQRVREAIDFKLPFLDFMPIHFIAALHGSGLGELMKDVDDVAAATKRVIKTPDLTRALEKAVFDHQPPAVVGRRIKLRYAHLGGRDPITIIVHGNQTEKLPVAYTRYLTNEFRRAFDLKGLPLRVEVKTGDNPFKGKKNVLTGRQVKKRARQRDRWK